jgi:hypothetical protein
MNEAKKEKAIVNLNRQQCGILMQNMFSIYIQNQQKYFLYSTGNYQLKYLKQS